MSINKVKGPITLVGVGPHEIEVDPDYKVIQIDIAGRTTGTVPITATARGGAGAKALDPAASMDLANQDSIKLAAWSLSSVTLGPVTAGADMIVTITQWPV
jgi:hypothetical protein